MTLALTISHNLPRQWLFPDHDSLVGRPGTRTISWIDHNLNKEQQVGLTATRLTTGRSNSDSYTAAQSSLFDQRPAWDW